MRRKDRTSKPDFFVGSFTQPSRRPFIVSHNMPGKAAKNEREYPYVVEFVVAGDKLDVELSRRMMDFHSSRKIPARHGRRIVREGQIFFRWCFSDLATAGAFREQFDGEVAATRVMKAGRLASNIVAVIAPATWRCSLD